MVRASWRSGVIRLWRQIVDSKPRRTPCVGCRVAQASIAGGDHDLLLRRRRAMEHKPRVDLQAIADLSPVKSRAPMRREERLARWVEVLERDPKRILETASRDRVQEAGGAPGHSGGQLSPDGR